MPPPRRRAVAAAVLAAALAALAATARPAPASAGPPETVLYDGALGTGTPDTQGFLYLTRNTVEPLLASHSFAGGVTTLTTTLRTGDLAGYFANAAVSPSLDRRRGFGLRFRIQVTGEEHAASDKDGDGVADRAGFSVIAIGSDGRGIELGFWAEQVWAQRDGAAEPPGGTLFTHGEGAPFDTASAMAEYHLTVMGDAYRLTSDRGGTLTGPLRDYSVFGFPYNVPNFVFLGDDTSTASAVLRLARFSVEGPGRSTVYLPRLR